MKGRQSDKQKSVWREGNEAHLLINGEEFYPAAFAAIGSAHHQVLLETFIIHEDKVGIQLQQALIAAARRGVEVDVMADDYGTFELSAGFVAALVDAGVKLHVFDPGSRPLGRHLNIFRRLHRKILVIDGVLAFVGGINYSIEHTLEFGAMAKQDYAVQVRGPIVNDIHRASTRLLLEASRKGRAAKSGSAPPFPATEALARGKFNPPENGSAGQVRIRLAVRDNNRHTSDIEALYLEGIRSAKERIVIANAYFFPGYRLLRALRNAARRGLEVTLILQGQPDMAWVSMCSRLLYNYLIKEGVTIYEYRERPLHGKVAIVDRHWTTIGSSNLDPLSLALNLEANLFLDDEDFNQQLYRHLHQLVQTQCKRISLQRARRGYWWRLPFIFLSFHFLRNFPAIARWLPAHSPELKPLRPEDLPESTGTKSSVQSRSPAQSSPSVQSRPSEQSRSSGQSKPSVPSRPPQQ